MCDPISFFAVLIGLVLMSSFGTVCAFFGVVTAADNFVSSVSNKTKEEETQLNLQKIDEWEEKTASDKKPEFIIYFFYTDKNEYLEVKYLNYRTDFFCRFPEFLKKTIVKELTKLKNMLSDGIDIVVNIDGITKFHEEATKCILEAGYKIKHNN